jgi:hypothetical protein
MSIDCTVRPLRHLASANQNPAGCLGRCRHVAQAQFIKSMLDERAAGHHGRAKKTSET